MRGVAEWWCQNNIWSMWKVWLNDVRITLLRLYQWGAADAEIKVPSDENTELKRSPFKAWSRSVYSHTCYTYCQEFLPYFYPSSPFICIFSKTSSDFFPALAVANTGSCVGPQIKIGQPAGGRFPCWVPAEYKQAQKPWLVVWRLVKWLTWR